MSKHEEGKLAKSVSSSVQVWGWTGHNLRGEPRNPRRIRRLENQILPKKTKMEQQRPKYVITFTKINQRKSRETKSRKQGFLQSLSKANHQQDRLIKKHFPQSLLPPRGPGNPCPSKPKLGVPRFHFNQAVQPCPRANERVPGQKSHPRKPKAACSNKKPKRPQSGAK